MTRDPDLEIALRSRLRDRLPISVSKSAALVCALALSPAVHAQGRPTYALPEGCTASVTMQKHGCVVTHLFTCQGDPAGFQRRVDIEEDGPTYFGTIDAETQWIESQHLLAGRIERLVPDPVDPASLSALLATGRDDYDFVTRDDAGYETRFAGYDILTGATEEIDGVTLDVTEFAVTATDANTGAVVWTVTGSEYVNRDWRTFVSGRSTYVTGDGEFTNDLRPVTFHFPGEPGFLARSPIHDCGALMSSADDAPPSRS